MRRHRSDLNQAEIVKALRGYGCSVWDTSNVGNGFPDLAIGIRKKVYLLEVKQDNVPPSQRKLTPDEANFFATWNGHCAVVHNIEEALIAVGIKKK